MKKLILIFIPILIILSTLVARPARASASTSNLIDDGVFTNTASMGTANDIDFWLNNYFGSSSCISSFKGFTTPDPQGFSAGSYHFGSNVTAGQAIYDIAKNYNLNPQVILSTLQKEQSVVTGSAGCYSNTPDSSATFSCYINANHPNGPCTTACPYSGGCLPIAMSYYCPGNCLAAAEGFSYQLSGGTWALRWAQQRAYGNLTGYSGYDAGDENILYQGPLTAGWRQRVAGGTAVYSDGTWTDSNGQSTTISNGATASLYSYTPFISDSNFSSIFKSWFGDPYDTFTAQPVWQGVFSDSGYTNLLGWNASITPSQSAWVVVVMKNTSNVTWTKNGGGNDVRLVTYNTWGHQSIFCNGNSGWIATSPICTRPAAFDEASVPPGSNGTFRFRVDAPPTPGLYNEAYSLIIDGKALFKSGVVNIGFDIGTYYSAQPAWQGVFSDSGYTNLLGWDATIAPNQPSYITIVMKNTGNVTWTKNGGGNDVRLVTYNTWGHQSIFCNGNSGWIATSPICTRPAAFDEASVPPGSNGTFRFRVDPPAAQGSYTEAYGLIIDGKTMFNTGVAVVRLNVGYSYSAQSVWQGVFNDSSKAVLQGWNGTVSRAPGNAWVVVVMKNTSNVTWTKNGGGNDVRLVTYNTWGHQSIFCNGNSGWIATSPICTRPAAFDEASVPPGSNGTFEFRVDAPMNPGSYTEAYGLIIDGKTVFNTGVSVIKFTVN